MGHRHRHRHRHQQSTIAMSHQPSAIDAASTMKRIALAIVASVTITAVSAQSNDSTLARIRSEGLEHSQAAATFDYLTINIGPRLTASPAHKRAVEWTR